MKRNVGMKEGPVYELDGRVPLKKAMPLGIQHVLAMFLGNVSPLLIVCGLLDIALDMKTVLIQNAMFVAAIATLLQLYPIRRFGSRLPIVMGTSSGFIGTAQIIGSAFGYGALMGASMVGSLFEMVLGFFIRPLRKLFPPIVTSLVIVTMGLTLLPVGINYLGGGAGAEDFGSLQHLGVGFFVMLVILIAKQMKGFINDISILIGIVAGYLLAIALGMVDFQPVAEAAWISLPQFLPVMPTFHMEAILAMGIMFVATAVETIGNISGITNGAFDREPTIEEMQGGVLADSAGSFFGSFFGVLPCTAFAQNVGLVVVSKIVNRFVIMTGAVFLLLCGFCPKLSALFSGMPQSVLGGAAVIMFAMILVSGIQSLAREPIDERAGLIIALSLGLGVGIGNVPEVLAQLPQWVSSIFAQNSIIMTFVIATLLNLLLPKKKKAEE